MWDAGIESVLDADDLVPSHSAARAAKALGLPAGREEMSVSYWLTLSGLNREEFEAKLATVGVNLNKNVRKIPKNSLRKIRRLFSVDPGLAMTDRRQEQATIAPMEWVITGSTAPEIFLDQEEVVAIHVALEEDFRLTADPILPPGVRDSKLLASALARPRTALGDQLKYPTVEMAGAALFHSLVHNHAFHNGNKRTALVGLLVYLDKNGMVFTCDENTLFKFLLRVGQHSLVAPSADNLPDREVLEISKWIRNHSRKLSKQELPLRWLKLKQRLSDFGCQYAPATGKGNRLDIWRDVPVPGRFRPKTQHLSFQVYWGGDGTEAEKNTIHELRRALHLDDEHGVDSECFYQGATIDAFIIEYRRILQRLAKF